MKILDGKELASYIKVRQAKEVRRLKQSLGVNPTLAIVHETIDPAIMTYMRLKAQYGDDVGVNVDVYKSMPGQTLKLMERLNVDSNIHGIIAQLPLDTNTDTNQILNAVDPHKDVDGLSDKSEWDPAAPTAILWLLSGYGVELFGKKVAVVGHGRLVGAPLVRMLNESDIEPIVFDEINQDEMIENLPNMEVIICATGKPGLIGSKLIKENAIVVDAGTSSDSGSLKGDLADDARDRQDLTITPIKGGVGPLTVCALFENVLRAANKSNLK